MVLPSPPRREQNITTPPPPGVDAWGPGHHHRNPDRGSGRHSGETRPLAPPPWVPLPPFALPVKDLPPSKGNVRAREGLHDSGTKAPSTWVLSLTADLRLWGAGLNSSTRSSCGPGHRVDPLGLRRAGLARPHLADEEMQPQEEQAVSQDAEKEAWSPGVSPGGPRCGGDALAPVPRGRVSPKRAQVSPSPLRCCVPVVSCSQK